MGRKRARPWGHGGSVHPGFVAVAAAVWVFSVLLAAPEVIAFSSAGPCCRVRRVNGQHDNSVSASCKAKRHDRPRHRREKLGVGGCSHSSAQQSAAAAEGENGHHAVIRAPQQPQPAPAAAGPALASRPSSHQAVSSRRKSSMEKLSRSRDRAAAGRAEPVVSAAGASPAAAAAAGAATAPGGRSSADRRRSPAVAQPLRLPPTTTGRRMTMTPTAATGKGTTRIDQKRCQRKRENDVRMYLLERGLCHKAVRSVLQVVRSDSELVNDIAGLAARMQAIADLLEAAGAWYDKEGGAAAGGAGKVAQVDEPGSTYSGMYGGGGPPPPLCASTSAKAGILNDGSRQQQEAGAGQASRHERAAEPPPPPPPPGLLADVDRSRGTANTQGVGGAMAPGTVEERLHVGVGAGGQQDRGLAAVAGGAQAATVASEGKTASAAEAAEETAEAAAASTLAAREGARSLAYKLVSREPRLLLVHAETDLAARLRFLLDSLPGLRRDSDGRRVAPLLAIDTATLKGRLEGLAEVFPDHVDLQVILNKAPLLLRRSTESVSEALTNLERTVPGIRIDRVLRAAPQLLVQPLDAVEERLSHLRAVLGLASSPVVEEAWITVGKKTSGISGTRRAQGEGDERGGRGVGSVGGESAGPRPLARFANAFPQILAMEPHTVRAKIKGLEALLLGMDGLAVVSSRPQLLGFSVRGNVSHKVSGLRALMEVQGQRREAGQLPRQQQLLLQQKRRQQQQGGGELAAAVARCPSLLTLSSDTAARKLEELQEALPPGVDARTVVAKEPRVMALDTQFSVPRKLDGFARVLAEHAGASTGSESPGACSGASSSASVHSIARAGSSTRFISSAGTDADTAEGLVAAAMAEVLQYYPNALRFDTTTLAGKLTALRSAGLSGETVLAVVRGAPRCLSVAARTLRRRVLALTEALPSVCVNGLLGAAPSLLVNRIDPPAARVGVLRELFPTLSPVHLVEGAPMLLALSESTLRAKSDAWRSIIECSVQEPWEEAIATFPKLLCQGLGRAARVAFLLLPADAQSVASTASSSFAAKEKSASAARAAPAAAAAAMAAAAAGGAPRATAAPTATGPVVVDRAESRSEKARMATAPYGGGGGGARTRTMSLATASHEICRRVADFEADHPGYPAFLDSLLFAAGGRPTAVGSIEGVRVDEVTGPAWSLNEGFAGARVSPAVGGTVSHTDGVDAFAQGLIAPGPIRKHRQQKHYGYPGSRAVFASFRDAAPDRGKGGLSPVQRVSYWKQQPRQQRRLFASSASPPRRPAPLPRVPLAPAVPPVSPADEVRITVKIEKALGAAMTAAAKGPGGGTAAASMLLTLESIASE